jgi:hypothetical protein
MGPPHLVSIYAVVKDPRRGKRQGGDEPRAQEYMRVMRELSPQAAYPGEARVPKSIVQEGKKGSRSLTIVFTEIRSVTEFAEEI